MNQKLIVNMLIILIVKIIIIMNNCNTIQSIIDKYTMQDDAMHTRPMHKSKNWAKSLRPPKMIPWTHQRK